MKKYFLFAVSFLSLIVFFSFHNVFPAQAAPGSATNGAKCANEAHAPEEYSCQADFRCDTSHPDRQVYGTYGTYLPLFPGICVPKPILACECDPPVGGNNAFLCAPPGAPPGARKDLRGTCEKSEDICKPAAADFPSPVDRVNRIELPNDPEGGTEDFRGISCQNPVFPECSCIGSGNVAGSGQNGVQCKVNGVVVGEGYCKDNKACRAGGTWLEQDVHLLLDKKTNANSAIPNSAEDLPNEDNDLRGKVVQGITCGVEQITCECIDGGNVPASGKNGIRCTNSAGAVIGEGFCKHLKACIPGGTIPESEVDQLINGSANGNSYSPIPNEDRDMRGKELRGVHCEARQVAPPPPLPPVPPPPCAEGRLNNGVCEAFVTALGTISTDISSFITTIFALLLAISGGIALLLIMRAGYTLMTSVGNSEKVQAGRDQLVAAIVGLLFIIFSFVILEVIAVDILNIPGGGGADGGGSTIGVPPGSVPYGGDCTGDADCSDTPGAMRCYGGICGDAGGF